MLAAILVPEIARMKAGEKVAGGASGSFQISTLKTVLNAEIFAAIPAMNAASRPVIATPVRP
jgi:hypothetical protein